MARNPGIEQDIAWTGIEAGSVDRRRASLLGRQNTDVADTANIDCHACLAGAAEYCLMKGQYQWRTLAASGDIAAAEIGDDIDAAQLRQQGRIISLARITEFGPMTNGLAVHADGAYLCCCGVALCQQLRYTGCITNGELIGRQRFALQFISPGALQGHQLGPQTGGEGGIGSCQRTHWLACGHGYQYAIDAIEAGAGHQSNVERGSCSRDVNELSRHKKTGD